MKHILPLVKTFFIGKQKWEIPYWSSIENRRDLQEQFKETRKKTKKKEKIIQKHLAMVQSMKNISCLSAGSPWQTLGLESLLAGSDHPLIKTC